MRWRGRRRHGRSRAWPCGRRRALQRQKPHCAPAHGRPCWPAARLPRDRPPTPLAAAVRGCSTRPPTPCRRCAPAARSPTCWRAARPSCAPGAQALSFHVLRWLGAPRGCARCWRPRRRRRRSTPCCCTALALLWPGERAALRRAHAGRPGGDAARQRTPAGGRLRQRRAAPLPARARRAGGRGAAHAGGAPTTTRRGGSSACRHDWPHAVAGAAGGGQRAPADDAARQRPPRHAARPTCSGWPRPAAPPALLDDPALGGQAVVLAEPCPVQQLPGFAEGEVSVQDAAAQRAAPLLLGGGAAAAPAPACWTPAPRPAARPRTCWSWPTWTCWRWTATRSAWPRVQDTLSRLQLHGRAAGRRRRATRPPGGTAGPSTPSCSTRPAAPRASCAATPTCAGCAGPTTSPRWPRIQARAAGRAVAAAGARRAAAVRHLLGLQGRGPGRRSTLFCNATAAQRPGWTRRRPATCCRCPTMPIGSPAAGAGAARRLLLRPDPQDLTPTPRCPPMPTRRWSADACLQGLRRLAAWLLAAGAAGPAPRVRRRAVELAQLQVQRAATAR